MCGMVSLSLRPCLPRARLSHPPFLPRIRSSPSAACSFLVVGLQADRNTVLIPFICKPFVRAVGVSIVSHPTRRDVVSLRSPHLVLARALNRLCRLVSHGAAATAAAVLQRGGSGLGQRFCLHPLGVSATPVVPGRLRVDHSLHHPARRHGHRCVPTAAAVCVCVWGGLSVRVCPWALAVGECRVRRPFQLLSFLFSFSRCGTAVSSA